MQSELSISRVYQILFNCRLTVEQSLFKMGLLVTSFSFVSHEYSTIFEER